MWAYNSIRRNFTTRRDFSILKRKEILLEMYTKLLKLFKTFLRLEKHRTELKLKDIEIRVALLNHVRSVWAFITDLMIDWILLLWISKVKPNYTIRNSLPGTTCDVNLSNTTLFAATMLINNCRVLKILQNCTFLLFSHQVFLYKFVSHGLCGPRK